MDVDEISFLSTGSLLIEGDNLKVEQRTTAPRYDKYFLYNLSKGDKVTLKISGIPEGRSTFWIVGWQRLSFYCLPALDLPMTRPQSDEA